MSKTSFVIDLKPDDEVLDFFLVKNSALKIGSNHKMYLDITLADKTGDISCKKWDVSEEEANIFSAIRDGSIVKAKAVVSEWNGFKQMKIVKLRDSNEADSIDMADFVKTAPEDPELMYQYILEQAKAIKDEGLKKLCVKALEDNYEKLLYFPAAKANHHAEMGGLLYHTRRMLTMGIKACSVYTKLDKDWVVAGVIMHDMEKINEIASNQYGIASSYTMKGNLLGHIVLGVIKLEDRAKEAGLSEEKTIMLQHMILAHHNEPEFGSPVRPCFAEAELLHHLDMIDARMYDFEEALVGVEKGSFSERVRTLDNRMVYNPTFEKENTEEK